MTLGPMTLDIHTQHRPTTPFSTAEPAISMAKVLQKSSSLFFIVISFFISFVIFSVTGENSGFVKAIDRKTLGLRKEKLSHFRVYWHDIVSGRSPTSVPVTQPSLNSSTAFGLMNMIDNPLTEGPELSSKMVGRAQGFYASASQEEVGLIMAMNFAFIEGKYNGSTITVLGRNSVFNKMREMPVIGGSGLFRFARGYVHARTHTVDLKSGDATVKYDCYVMHY
ncbi:unnamed protein product [Ilex paraguariensis]|uniref:Dirigent protein n=1 Tax=Ilex paraguariensis TaxID=185542 RepID=A0ABC8RDC1_9AQUA